MIYVLLFIFIFIPAVIGKSVNNRTQNYMASKNNREDRGYTPPSEPGILVRMFRIIFWLAVVVWILT